MSDLTDRLNNAASISEAYYPKDLDHPPLLREAANRIEALIRANAVLTTETAGYAEALERVSDEAEALTAERDARNATLREIRAVLHDPMMREDTMGLISGARWTLEEIDRLARIEEKP